METMEFLLIRNLQNQINVLAERPDKMNPIGSVISFAGEEAPSTWLLCNGSSKSSIDYPELFSVIGTKYGGVDGNFNLPNLTNKFIRGANTENLAHTGGGTITISTHNLPEHNHGLTNGTAIVSTSIPDHNHQFSSSLLINNGSGIGGGSPPYTSGNYLGGALSGTNSSSLTCTAVISGFTDISSPPYDPEIPIVPSFLALNYIIYAGR